ncbi:putative wsc domain-containing protein [Botrytis fragariae]|uniref:Putative wsc domain-containing protein n=1 Tax=Botrytis fragariae TaxID=1964551 RepID=A0A8H6ECD9_9HELO|nr:putative wsc domain-containing protein [Botrytis fragariae]KAF5867436.1 putative wsc domain-containing protein [Botrytis fragariae]
MILSNLLIASLGIISVTSSQSFSATNVCLDALSSEPNDAKSFCTQYLVSSTIPIPSFASPCLATDPSDNQLFKSCYELLHQLENEVSLPEVPHLGVIEEPVKRGETLPRDGGFFNTGSVPSVTTNIGTYDNYGCFEDSTRGKPLGSPLLNLIGSAADTIQSCVNACSISGQNGIPYRYAGIEPGSCWCSNYISILAIKSSSFCQSTCPSNYGKYCGGIVGGILHMQLYELKNVNPTSTMSVKTTSSSLKSSVKPSISTSQSGTTSKFLSLTTQTSSRKSSSISKSSSSASPTNPISSSESYILPSGTFAYPSELSTPTQSFGLPPDPPTIPPIVGPTGTDSYIQPSGTFAYPSEVSTTGKPNPWASLTLEEPKFWTQVPSDAVPGFVEPTTTLQSISTATSPPQKVKREYDITAPDSPWLALLPLTSPEIFKEVLPGQVPGWDQHAIAKEKKLKSREYDIYAPDKVTPDQVPGWKHQSIAQPPDKVKREYDINAPDSPWRPVLPLYTPSILKSVPEGQVPENFLEPPGRPDFIKAYPEKDNNKRLPAPFNKMPDAVDPKTGKKLPIPKPKPRYSHSKISLQKFPSLKEIGLEQDGREHQNEEDTDADVDADEDENEKTENAKRISDLQKIRDRRYAHKLHLQGTPKAYAEMREKSERSAHKGHKRIKMEEWEKRIFRGLGKEERKGEEEDLLLREDAIINRVWLGEDGQELEDGEDESWTWRKWSGGGKRKGRKIRLER